MITNIYNYIYIYIYYITMSMTCLSSVALVFSCRDFFQTLGPTTRRKKAVKML